MSRPILYSFRRCPYAMRARLALASADKAWFDTQGWPYLSGWLENFITSARFTSIMQKYPIWQAGNPVTLFP